MSRLMALLAAALLGSALVACGANGGDPVARRQIPAADSGGSDAAGSGDSGSDSSDSDSSGSDSSGSDSSGSDSSGSGDSAGGGSGGGSGSRQGSEGDDHARTVGLPKSIRIPEIGQRAFEQGVAAACGSKDGAPDCLTVRYETVQDPDHGCGFEWVADPPKESAGDGTASTVQRGATLTATIYTCPAPAESTTPPGGTPGSTPDDPATTMDPAAGTPTP